MNEWPSSSHERSSHKELKFRLVLERSIVLYYEPLLASQDRTAVDQEARPNCCSWERITANFYKILCY